MTEDDKPLIEAMKDAVLHGAGFLKNGKHVPIDDVYIDHCEAARMEERDRIVGIIKRRIDLHSEFVKGCMDHEVEPASGVLGAISELRSLLRGLEQ